MLRFLSYLLVFVIGGGIGFFLGGVGGGGAGALYAGCKVVNETVAQNLANQEQANALVRSVVGEMAKQMSVTEEQLKQQMPAILERMKKESGGAETPCQVALKSL